MLRAAMMRARVFVNRFGLPFEQLRVDVLVGEQPGRAVAPWVEERQSREGAVASLANPSEIGLRSTAQWLGTLEDLRLLHLACAERAAAYCASTQRPDGGFIPAPEADAEECLIFTASLAGTLARLASVRPAVLDAAGEYLASRWSVEQVQGGDRRVIAAWLHFFASHPHELSDAALQWCGRELEGGFRSGRFDAVATARVFVACDARALPGARLDVDELVAAVLGEQARDGGFGDPTWDGPARVPTTSDAILALVRLA
jgi:hypothetical protein